MSQPSSHELKQFHQQGYIALRGFFDAGKMQEIETALGELLEHTVPSLPDSMVFYEDKDDPATLKQIQQLASHHPYFERLQNDSPVRQVAESLLGSEVVPQNTQFFSKPPGIGKPTPPHQDGFYFMLQPCEAVTLWLALDDIDEENGCVRYVAGSHQRGLRDHARTSTLGFSQGIAGYPTVEDQLHEVPVPASPGDLLVHHAMTIHLADGNTSDRPRRSLGFVYYSVNAQQDTHRHREYQEQLAREMREQGKI